MKFGVPEEAAKQIAAFLVSYGLITEEHFSHATASSAEGGKGLLETINWLRENIQTYKTELYHI